MLRLHWHGCIPASFRHLPSASSWLPSPWRPASHAGPRSEVLSGMLKVYQKHSSCSKHTWVIMNIFFHKIDQFHYSSSLIAQTSSFLFTQISFLTSAIFSSSSHHPRFSSPRHPRRVPCSAPTPHGAPRHRAGVGLLGRKLSHRIHLPPAEHGASPRDARGARASRAAVDCDEWRTPEPLWTHGTDGWFLVAGHALRHKRRSKSIGVSGTQMRMRFWTGQLDSAFMRLGSRYLFMERWNPWSCPTGVVCRWELGAEPATKPADLRGPPGLRRSVESKRRLAPG